MTERAFLTCKGCGQWTWHDYDQTKDLGDDAVGKHLGFELVFTCSCCDERRRWGIVAQRDRGER